MYLANKPHDPQKLLETSFQVILFLDSRGFSSVLEGISRFCNILEPKPTKEPSCGLPKYVAVPVASRIPLLMRMVLQFSDDKILLLLTSASCASLLISWLVASVRASMFSIVALTSRC